MSKGVVYKTQTQAGKAGEYIADVLEKELPRLELYKRLAERLTNRIEEDTKILAYPDSAVVFTFASRKVYQARKEKNEYLMAALIRRVNRCVQSLAVVLPVGSLEILNEKHDFKSVKQ